MPDLRRSRAPVFTAVVVIAALGGGVAVMWPRDKPWTTSIPTGDNPDEPKITRRVEPKTFRVEIETDPRGATIELDGRPVGRGVLDQRLPLDGTEHVIVSRASGYREMTVRFTDQPPPHLLALDPAPAPSIAPVADSSAERSAPLTDRRPDRMRRPGRRFRDSSGGAREARRALRNRDAPSGVSGTMPNGAPIID